MKTVIDPPVFVVGSGRSGTTLLYSILQSSGAFALYQAETLLLEVCQHRYGNLRNKKNYDRFMNDWIQSKQFNRSGLSPEVFIKEAKNNFTNYIEFMRFFMECITLKQGKTRWAEQTPGHVFYMKELSESFPGAKFIHMIRDGRDVAISRRKLKWTGTKSQDPIRSLISAAKSWEICIKKGQQYGKILGDNYIEVRYEEMIQNLDKALEKISRFIDVKIDHHMVENSRIGSLGRANTAFSHQSSGISDKNLGRWRSQLTHQEIYAVQLAIGDTLDQLGYEVDNSFTQYSLKSINLEAYIRICPIILKTKQFLKEKTVLGRLTASTIEMGLQ